MLERGQAIMKKLTKAFLFKLWITAIAWVVMITIADAQPQAKFTSDITSGCAPVTINFQSQTSGNNLRYLWFFGNGNVSTLANPQAIYYQPGKYEVSLTVTDSTGKNHTKTISGYIQVFKNPVANFSGTPLGGCTPLSTNFTNLSTQGDGKITDFIWDFGDGNTLKDSVGKHTYKSQGQFNVSLVITDVNQCQDKKLISKYVEALPSPDPQIKADRRFYCSAPFTVNFTNATVGLQLSDSYLWEFGDGTTSKDKNPSHNYTQTGNYNVSLTITKANGCSVKRTLNSFVVIGNLELDFSANRTTGCTPSEIKFVNLTKPSIEGVTFQWLFGDGGLGNSANNVYHTYDKSGKYDVTLTANIDNNCKVSLTKSTYITIEDSPHAAFTMSDSLACKTPVSVTLINTSQNGTSFKWVINKKTAGEISPTAHTFTTIGNHHIELIAENFIGCKDTARSIFTIRKPSVAISASPLEGCAPLKVGFNRSTESFDQVKEYYWTFENGNRLRIDTEPTSHTFNKAGTYPVKLDIVTKNGCTASDTVMIRVGLKTDPSFAAGKDTMCNNELRTYKSIINAKGVAVDSFIWSLSKQAPSSSFSDQPNGDLKAKHEPGTYNLTLITENNGCFDTFVEENKITILAPLAVMGGSEVNLCQFDTIFKDNQSVGEDSIRWKIFYPNGSLMEIRWDDKLVFTRSYDQYSVLLTAFNKATGCVDSASEKLIFPQVVTEALIKRSGNPCAPSALTFEAQTSPPHTYTWYTEKDSFAGPNQQVSYTLPGRYRVQLKVTNPTNGCVDTISEHFDITGPEVSGEFVGNESCAPLSVQLKTNSNPNNFKELYWLIDTLKLPVKSAGTINHVLHKPGPELGGSYNIKLIGKDTNNCAGYQVFPIVVRGVIGANIKIRRIAHCTGRHFIFQVVAPGYDINKLSINWDFGDGSTSTKDVNDKFYDQDGIYNLVLKLTDSSGCVTQVVKTIDIQKEKVLAKFKADSLETACPPLFVKFRDLSTTAPGRRIMQWFWDFGDGSTSIESNPSKLYLFPGTFSVKLTVVDENKCRDSLILKDLILVSGPKGTFNFDKKIGCVPLDVNFTANQKDAVKYELDMGDGVVYEDKLNFGHTYSKPGRYIPVFVLTDSFGCTYTHPPIDTIFVFGHPRPDFTSEGVCYGKPISFKAINPADDGDIVKYTWQFTQGTHVQVSELAQPVMTFYGDIEPIVELSTVNAAGCSGSVKGQVKLSNLSADFEAESKFNCVGNVISINSKVTSDTTVLDYRWRVNNQLYTARDISLFADQTGPVKITFSVTNALGCLDSITTQKIVVGDTIPPLNIEILRVTINDDETVQLDLKPCSANDFISYELYREGLDGFMHFYSEEDQYKTTILSKGNNTLHQVYCFRAEVKNACGILSDSSVSIPHCTVEAEAFGEINRAVVRWNQYSGWQSIAGYEVLREEPSNPGSFIRLGTTGSMETSYIDSNIVCRAEHTYKIKAIEAAGNQQVSYSDTCKARPKWQHKPNPNELIRVTVEGDRYILIEWDSVHNPKVPIVGYVLQRSVDGVNYDLTWQMTASKLSFEDKKVAVDDRSYFYQTYAIDQCNDTGEVLNFGKTILLIADTTSDQRPFLHWSTYQGWNAGVDYYQVEIKNPDNSFSVIGQTANTDTSLVDLVTNLNQRPNYCYRITGFKNTIDGKPRVVSTSNEDCSPVFSRLYFPNAFTPNADNVNEGFGTPGIYIIDFHMTIYTRWGEKIFETRSMDEKWDGTYLGKPAQQGAYAVVVESVGVDRVKRTHFGTITLLR